MTRVDAHVHVWHLARGGYDWPDASVAADLACLRQHPKVVGIRALVHVRRHPGWVTTSRPLAALGEVARAGLVYDYVTGDPAGLAHLPTVLDRHPDLPVVLDHLGKPPVGGTDSERREWLALLRDVAAPQVSAKVSGLYSSRGPLDSWTPAQVRPFVQDALDVFGPERLMYGGDWPVAVLAGGYRRTAEALTGILADLLDPPALEEVLGGRPVGSTGWGDQSGRRTSPADRCPARSAAHRMSAVGVVDGGDVAGTPYRGTALKIPLRADPSPAWGA